VLLALDPLSANWRFYRTQVAPRDTGWNGETEARLAGLVEPAVSGREMPWRATMPVSMTNASQLIEGLAEPHGYDPAGPLMAVSRTIMTSHPTPPAERLALKSAAKAVRYEVLEETDGIPEVVPQRARTFSIRDTWPVAGIADLATSVSVTDDPLEISPIDGTGHLAYFTPDTEHWRQSVPPPCDSVTTAGLEVRHEPQPTPNCMVFHAQADRAAVLVVRSTWLPGWRCAVDGVPRGKPLRMNSWMIGVPLAAGSHTVRLWYRPVGLGFALLLSAVGVSACLAAWFASRRRRTAESSAGQR
jgi:hypothetical protein